MFQLLQIGYLIKAEGTSQLEFSELFESHRWRSHSRREYSALYLLSCHQYLFTVERVARSHQ